MAKRSPWKAFRWLMNKRRDPLDLDDATAFDFSDDIIDDELSSVHVLTNVAADTVCNSSTVRINGGRIKVCLNTDSEQLRPTAQVSHVSQDFCSGCNKKQEHEKQRKVRKRLSIAGILYLLFMIGELIGGYAANSLAVITDALHMLTDLIGIAATLLALWMASKRPTKRFTFGFHRVEVLSASLSVLLIYILTGFLLYEAVQRTIHLNFEIDGDVMLITAAVGVAVNLIMGFILNQSGHIHSHSHGPPGNLADKGSGINYKRSSLAVRAAFIHALGDLLQSIGVLIAAYIVRFKPEFKIADPICTYIFSVLVLFTTTQIMRDTGLIILEGAPRHTDVDHIREELIQIEHVDSVENLNVWSLTGGKTAAIVHLQLTPGSSSKWEEVQSKARHLLQSINGMCHCTVQVQSCKHAIDLCTKCQDSVI
ncbi:zinc transporter 4 [Protopterus annectens]|uniref:zinc transporter 4 n=1 Tax=Protopterus annectens TaxID=7888 RepID=UPI001CF9C5D6|nr:zinc transporter 4 [Protopterus annectens]XP_043933564.1 zinc transporter 4 [Protopterus annectens]XP_043933565.1 zinc transporter 4 [Protopterus annectens]XP_043933566.1 zinc transporter 4 [Protopterus annectens]XP_043933567.1 zinc transporter 4 [Protopterus annectens]